MSFSLLFLFVFFSGFVVVVVEGGRSVSFTQRNVIK